MAKKQRVNLYLLWILLAAASLATCVSPNSELTTSNAWARPAKTGENGVIYFVIENNTNTEDILLGSSTDIAEAAEAHISMQNDQGVVSMHRQETVQVPAGQEVAFKPGNLHIMLVNLNRDLKVNDVFTLTLRFQNAGKIKLQVEVKEQ